LVVDYAGLYLVHRGLRVFTGRVFNGDAFIARAQLRVDGVVDLFTLRERLGTLAGKRIVVVGDLTRSWRRFGPVIESDFRAQVLPGGFVPALVPAHEDGLARLRGTVALVLQKHFSTSEVLGA